MRFCDLFDDYKNRLKEISSTIPFSQLPLYRKVFVIFNLIINVLGIVSLIFKRFAISWGVIVIDYIAITIFLIVDNRQKNQEILEKKFFQPYSEERIKMTVNILRRHGIDINDLDKIDRIISEAQIAQNKCDYYKRTKMFCKIFAGIILSILTITLQRVINSYDSYHAIICALIVIAVILIVFGIQLIITPAIKHLLNREFNRYEDFIYDLRQIGLFYKDSALAVNEIILK